MQKLASITGDPLCPEGPMWPRESTLCGCWWAMREVEMCKCWTLDQHNVVFGKNREVGVEGRPWSPMFVAKTPVGQVGAWEVETDVGQTDFGQN